MLNIAGRQIGKDSPPFIIAEMSGNHNRSIERALEIVDRVAESGAHALKIQTYTPETMTLDIDKGEFLISDSNSIWEGQTLFDLYKLAATPWDWHKTIFDRALEKGVIPFSTPFDATAVGFLEELDVPCYKIASFENTDIPLIRQVARTGKPLIISTGMASVAEIDEAVQAARSEGNERIVLLKCTSTYPATPENTNVLTIPHMREMFGCEVGLSDHTLGVGTSTAAVAYGASVIEKHFTLDRLDGGVDSSFSAEPHEMTQLVLECERAWLALGKIKYGPTDAETNSLRFRRSLYATEDISSGSLLTEKNVRAIRPGLGLPPKYLTNVLGRKAKGKISRGTALRWDHLK